MTDSNATRENLINNAADLQRLRQALLSDQAGQLSATCARLARIAQARGIAPHVVDDVVQETLLEAWNHLDRLYAPEGFHLWIDEICRNVCRRYAHRRELELLRHAPLETSATSGYGSGEENQNPQLDIPDTTATDPFEALNHQDLALLLDRALGMLPLAARQVVEMCHLLELPRAEVAARLGLSSVALDTRLHRARLKLRQVLSGPLYHEAVSLGLTLDEAVAEGWRETRIWCPLCARHRLQGCFITFGANESPNIHLRCPECSSIYQQDTVHSMGLVSLIGLRSFRPAWKRTMQGLTDLMMQSLPQGLHPCLRCGKPASVQVIGRDSAGVSPPGPYPFWIHWRCNHCGEEIDSTGDVPSVDQLVYWSDPRTRQFMLRHQRWQSQPGIPAQYDGQQAIRFHVRDLESAESLTVLADQQTLRVLTIY